MHKVCVYAMVSAVLATGGGAAPPVYPCYRFVQTPVVDGNVTDDPAWQRLPAVTGFSKLGDGYTAAKQTTVRMGWSAAALYVGAVCEEPDAAYLKPRMHDGGPFWLEDGIELFFQPGETADVLQFGVTAGGAKGAAEGFPDFTQCRAAARIDKDAYSVEVRIPFALLRVTPRVGARWRGNFCRNIFTTRSGGDKFTAWPPVKTRFLEPDSFAYFEFRGPAPPPAEARALTDRLNRAYREYLLQQLRTLVAQGKEYLPTLEQAVGDREFGAKATTLRDQWRKATALAAAADKTPLGDLRRATASAHTLVQASYDLKYQFLIAKLFADD